MNGLQKRERGFPSLQIPAMKKQMMSRKKEGKERRRTRWTNLFNTCNDLPAAVESFTFAPMAMSSFSRRKLRVSEFLFPGSGNFWDEQKLSRINSRQFNLLNFHFCTFYSNKRTRVLTLNTAPQGTILMFVRGWRCERAGNNHGSNLRCLLNVWFKGGQDRRKVRQLKSIKIEVQPCFCWCPHSKRLSLREILTSKHSYLFKAG